MKLSEAIRLGAMMKPQAFGIYSNFAGSCAMGAAMDATAVPLGELTYAFPVLQTPLVYEDSCGSLVTIPLSGAVVQLNDYFHWSREEIADLVEQVERAVVDGAPVPSYYPVEKSRTRVAEKPEPVLV